MRDSRNGLERRRTTPVRRCSSPICDSNSRLLTRKDATEVSPERARYLLIASSLPTTRSQRPNFINARRKPPRSRDAVDLFRRLAKCVPRARARSFSLSSDVESYSAQCHGRKTPSETPRPRRRPHFRVRRSIDVFERGNSWPLARANLFAD